MNEENEKIDVAAGIICLLSVVGMIALVVVRVVGELLN